MGKEILPFRNIEIKKNKFYRNRSPIFLKRCTTTGKIFGKNSSFHVK